MKYNDKVNYKFTKTPNLKYKLSITNNILSYGCNDIFEVFTSFKENKEYLVSPNNTDYNLDIFSLIDNKKINSLKGHGNVSTVIKYFINTKNNDEYLISADNNYIVIVWDITNNFNIKYKIDPKYNYNINGVLLVFPYNDINNYIITSTYGDDNDSIESDQEEIDIYDRSTKIYSLNDGKFIKNIIDTSNIHIYYLLSWYNKNNNKYYIIQLASEKIIINNQLEDELYSELVQNPEGGHFSGFIYNRDNKDYLCSSSSNGFINIWDLYDKKIFKIIDTKNCFLYHIIQWNDRYIIVADGNNKSFKIIDLNIEKVILDVKGKHIKHVVSIKKKYHPIYGESLLSAGNDSIKLWCI